MATFGRKVRISAVPTGTAFWLPITVAEGVEVQCMYKKGSETITTNVSLVVYYQVFLIRITIMQGSVFVADKLFDGVPMNQLELYTRDMEVTLVS